MKNVFLLPLFCFIIAALGSCDRFPRDAEGTLQRIKDEGNIKIGITASATGADSQLVQGYARQHAANIVWVPGDQSALVQRISKNEIDIAIGGFTKEIPFHSKAAFTKPYRHTADKKYVIAIPKGENALLIDLEKYIDAHGSR